MTGIDWTTATAGADALALVKDMIEANYVYGIGISILVSMAYFLRRFFRVR
jgi:hypothetical protein